MFSIPLVTANKYRTPTSVLCLGATRLDGLEIDIVESYVGASIDEIGSEWAPSLRNILNQDILRVVDCPGDGTRSTGCTPCLEKLSQPWSINT